MMSNALFARGECWRELGRRGVSVHKRSKEHASFKDIRSMRRDTQPSDSRRGTIYIAARTREFCEMMRLKASANRSRSAGLVDSAEYRPTCNSASWGRKSRLLWLLLPFLPKRNLKGANWNPPGGLCLLWTSLQLNYQHHSA